MTLAVQRDASPPALPTMDQQQAQGPSAVARTGPRRELDKRSLDYIVRSGIAGGLAGCAAKTVVGPLDRVKILFQASNPQFAKYSGSWTGVLQAMRDINSQDGLRGLYRGHSATLLRIFPYAGIKFLAYEQIRARIIPTAQQETPFRRLISGSLAGVTSVFFTYPLEVVRVRLAFETKQGPSGGKSNLRRICSQIYHEYPHTSPTSSSKPLASAAAAAANTLPRAAAAPIEAVAAQVAPPRSGLINFYRGFSPTLVGMVPYAGVSFLVHDSAGDLLRHPSIAKYTTVPDQVVPATSSTTHAPRARLTNPAELASGAMAGLLSQTASYPLEIIRRRMQVGGAVGDGRRLRMRETARMIARESGWRGFFVGLGIGYVKVVPMVAVSFWTYERAKLALGI